MARDWVELHKTSDPNILKGIVEFTETNDSFVPEANPSSGVVFKETTGRVDGPFGKGRQYNISGDLYEDFVPPPEPPPTQDESDLSVLIADDADDKTDMEALFLKVPGTWSATDQDSAFKMILRKTEIARLQTVTGKIE